MIRTHIHNYMWTQNIPKSNHIWKWLESAHTHFTLRTCTEQHSTHIPQIITAVSISMFLYIVATATPLKSSSSCLSRKFFVLSTFHLRSPVSLSLFLYLSLSMCILLNMCASGKIGFSHGIGIFVIRFNMTIRTVHFHCFIYYTHTHTVVCTDWFLSHNALCICFSRYIRTHTYSLIHLH